MADVFLSYSSKDRAAAERLQTALTERGIDVFWDQETPPGQDWDTWIRSKLSTCKVAVVLWSRASVKSENVRHEAIVARKAGKLLPACVDPLEPEDFPMGLYIVQAVNLTDWRSDTSKGVARLIAEIEARLGRAPSAATAKRAAGPKSNAGALAGGVATLALAIFAGWYFLLRDDHPAQQVAPADIATAEASPAPSATCLDGSPPTLGICSNGSRPIPPAPVLGGGGGGRAEAGRDMFAGKILGAWNWDGLACADGPHVTLEDGLLVFTTPDSRLSHAIERQTADELLTRVIEPASSAGDTYRLTPEYFATDAVRNFNLIVVDQKTNSRDVWSPCSQ